jgi:hypothetical protein
MRAGLDVLDQGRPTGPSLPNKEDPDEVVKRLLQQVPEIMAQSRVYRMARRRERDDYEANFGPIRDVAAKAAEEAAIAAEEEEERGAVAPTPPPPDEEWAVSLDGVKLVIPTSPWQRAHHVYRFGLLHRPTGRTFQLEKVCVSRERGLAVFWIAVRCVHAPVPPSLIRIHWLIHPLSPKTTNTHSASATFWPCTGSSPRRSSSCTTSTSGTARPASPCRGRSARSRV